MQEDSQDVNSKQIRDKYCCWFSPSTYEIGDFFMPSEINRNSPTSVSTPFSTCEDDELLEFVSIALSL